MKRRALLKGLAGVAVLSAFPGEVPSVNAGTKTFSGTVNLSEVLDPGDTVYVNLYSLDNPKHRYTYVEVDASGHWECEVAPLFEGERFVVTWSQLGKAGRKG